MAPYGAGKDAPLATGGGNPGSLDVVVIDGQPVLRFGVAALLDREHDMAVVAEGATGREAIALARLYAPAVMLLDAQLTDRPAGEVCRTLRRERPGMGVLIFSALDDDRARFDAVIAGASGYLTKDSAPTEVVAAIRKAAAGESLFDRDAASDLLARLSREPPKADARLQRLKPTELRILHLISRGYTNRQIASRVNLSERTVKKYVSSILGKLAVSSRTGAAAYLAERSADPARAYVASPPPLSEIVRSLPQMADGIGSEDLSELWRALEEQHRIHEELRLQSEQLLADRDSLEAERQRYADLFQAAPVPYLVTDRLGLIVSANERASALLGLNEAQLAHRSLASFVPADSRRKFRSRLDGLDGADHDEWLVALETKSGLVPAVAQVSTVHDAYGELTQLRWVLASVLAPAPAPAPA